MKRQRIVISCFFPANAKWKNGEVNELKDGGVGERIEELLAGE